MVPSKKVCQPVDTGCSVCCCGGGEVGITSGELTTGSRSLGISKEHDTSLALVHKLLQRSLLAIIGLDVAAKALKRNDIARRNLASGLLHPSLVLLLRLLLLHNFLGGGWLAVGLLLLVLGSLGVRDLIGLLDDLADLGGRAGLLLDGRRGGGLLMRLALAELDRHDDWGGLSLGKLEE